MAFPEIGKFLIDGYGEKPAPLMRRTEMESGPVKQHRKAPRRPVQRPCRYRFTPAEFTTFKAWVDSEGAVDAFNWIDPFDGSTKLAQLVNGVYDANVEKDQEGAALAWQIEFTLEVYE